MSQVEIVEIIEQIKQEIEVDANGQAKASLRATARLAGVSAVAILKTLYHFTLILIQVGSKGAGGKEQGERIKDQSFVSDIS